MPHIFTDKVFDLVQTRKNYVCVGIDPDISLLPAHLPKTMDGLYTFLSEIISATEDLCVAYKPNLSFFEAYGIDGISLLKRLPFPIGVPVILDAKRGDIGNTAKKQAEYLFDFLGADATTLHPYMGSDSLIPFFEYKDRFNFVLCMTSNASAAEFQLLSSDGKPLCEHVLGHAGTWRKKYGNVGIVVGATQTELPRLRSLDASLLFLVPGVGAQGGSYDLAVSDGKNEDGLVLINMSRSVLYADGSQNFAAVARQVVQSYLN